MSRAAHQSRRVKTGAVCPAQRGATRSLTAPTPRTRKTAVSPPVKAHTDTHSSGIVTSCASVFCIQTTPTALTFTSWEWKKKISSAATPPRCASTPRGSAMAPMIAATTLTRPTARVSAGTHKDTHFASSFAGRSRKPASIRKDLRQISFSETIMTEEWELQRELRKDNDLNRC